MQLSSDTDRCTQVRYSSVINTGNVTVNCFLLRCPPAASLTDLQLCSNVHENSKVKNGCDIRSSKQLLTLVSFVNDEEVIPHSTTL